MLPRTGDATPHRTPPGGQGRGPKPVSARAVFLFHGHPGLLPRPGEGVRVLQGLTDQLDRALSGSLVREEDQVRALVGEPLGDGGQPKNGDDLAECLDLLQALGC